MKKKLFRFAVVLALATFGGLAGCKKTDSVSASVKTLDPSLMSRDNDVAAYEKAVTLYVKDIGLSDQNNLFPELLTNPVAFKAVAKANYEAKVKVVSVEEVLRLGKLVSARYGLGEKSEVDRLALITAAFDGNGDESVKKVSLSGGRVDATCAQIRNIMQSRCDRNMVLVTGTAYTIAGATVALSLGVGAPVAFIGASLAVASAAIAHSFCIDDSNED